MRYEHIELNISTAACAELERMLDDRGMTSPELINLMNELRARLQRRDVDPHCPKNFQTEEDWLTC